jgi:hypothetical protein
VVPAGERGVVEAVLTCLVADAERTEHIALDPYRLKQGEGIVGGENVDSGQPVPVLGDDGVRLRLATASRYALKMAHALPEDLYRSRNGAGSTESSAVRSPASRSAMYCFCS